MYSSTPFQFLPPHIVSLIVDHVVNSTRTRFNLDWMDLKEREKVLIPLQWVCRNLRDNVHSRFFYNCSLNLLASKDRPSKAGIVWPLSPRVPAHSTHHLAKTLNIAIDSWEIYSGVARKLQSVPPFDGITFPLVNKLTVFICSSIRREDFKESNDGFPYNTTHNIGEFVRQVKQMAPAIGQVVINTSGKPTDSDGDEERYFKDLVSRLFEIGETTVLKDPSGHIGPFVDMDRICDLVHLTFPANSQTSLVLSLARRNAQTLQYLDLSSLHGVVLTGLIQDPDSGNCVEYPRLCALKLQFKSVCRSPCSSTLSGAAPFPCLLRLYLGLCYFFDDDVLFRGNAATLEYLKLLPCRQTVSLLNKYQVFTPSSHPQLQHVAICPPPLDTSYSFDMPVAYLEFVMSIAPRASVRQIPNMDSYDEDFTSALSILGDYPCIQVLTLGYADLSLWQAIILVKSLPLLSDMKIGAPTLGELPPGVAMSGLPEYVRSNHAPIGKRFRCWHITYNPECNVAEMAMATLLLALACPNFSYAAVDGDFSQRFMKAMRKKIFRPEFRKDMPRLKRLLFNGGKDR
ncbi:hypothetical protein GGI13_000954 [Coemansia sp. RSA 455]|nr:hypothetical protein GGI09_004320 [Coemansia sp. S100]KAJ2257278.1 hypothetical protein GGI13_000954 [Coemansia sp. RSA 455]